MSSYRGTQGRPDKLKAMAGVAAVHIVLAAVIVTGLNVDTVRRAVEQMQTIAVFEPDPPDPPRPPERLRPDTAPEEAGAPAKKAEPTPVVAPEQRIPAPSPIPAAKVAGQGSATTSGAAAAGSGTGAGGSGFGPGGGGDGSGFTPVVLIRNLNRGDYRPLAAGRLPRGSAMVALTVDTRGMPGNCRVVRSSGDSIVDSGLCPLVTRRLRFRPARDASGRAIPYTLQYVANWSV